MLEELSPGVVAHLCALADQLADAAQHAPETPETTRVGLSRAVRDALGKLSTTASRKARVRLPGGLVARYDRERHAVVVEPSPPTPGAEHPSSTRREGGKRDEP